MNDTWGISGPRFLVIYAVLLGLACLVVVLGRRMLARPPDDRPADTGALDPYDVAMLTGGERHAVTTAVFQLSDAGVLAVGGDPPLVTPKGPIPMDAHPVEQAVYERVGVAGEPPRVVVSDAERAPALATLRDRLVQRGLLVRPERTRQARVLAALLAAAALWDMNAGLAGALGIRHQSSGSYDGSSGSSGCGGGGGGGCGG